MEKLKTAQEYIKTTNPSVDAGFNMFVYGESTPLYNEYHDHHARYHGYAFAIEMAKKGKIAFTHKFNCKCGGYPFLYGGYWVCNSCGKKNVDEDWWKIKVEKDGNAYCCHGLDFINLQESNNYAFGDTYKEAIDNYGKLMIKN